MSENYAKPPTSVNRRSTHTAVNSHSTVPFGADLKASVEQFGYFSPIIAWRNAGGELVVLDGHARRDVWLNAIGEAKEARSLNPDTPIGLAARWPQIVEIELPDRDAALLWIIDNQRGRRNLADLDRIALAAKREQIIARKAKQNSGTRTDLLAKLPTGSMTHTRAECAKSAGVGERTYDAGKTILQAVEVGTATADVLEDIRHGRATIHGVAKRLKGETEGKPVSKAKSSGWQSIVRVFSNTVRRFIKRDPRSRAEIVARLRRFIDELNDVNDQAAA